MTWSSNSVCTFNNFKIFDFVRTIVHFSFNFIFLKNKLFFFFFKDLEKQKYNSKFILKIKNRKSGWRLSISIHKFCILY